MQGQFLVCPKGCFSHIGTANDQIPTPFTPETIRFWVKHPRGLKNKVDVLEPNKHIQHIGVRLVKVRPDNAIFYFVFIVLNML